MQNLVTPEMVDYSVEVANLALGNHDLIVEIVQHQDELWAEPLVMSPPQWDITLRRPTPEERRQGVRVVMKVEA